MTAKDGATSGNLQINNLPFSSRPDTNYYSPIGFDYISNLTLTTNYTQVGGYVGLNSTSITITQQGSAQAESGIPASGLAATSSLMFSGEYSTI
jgi:hypothetical protein